MPAMILLLNVIWALNRGQARSHRGVVLLDFDRIKNAIHLYKILFLKNFKPGGLVKIDEFKIIFAFKQNHATPN